MTTKLRYTKIARHSTQYKRYLSAEINDQTNYRPVLEGKLEPGQVMYHISGFDQQTHTTQPDILISEVLKDLKYKQTHLNNQQNATENNNDLADQITKHENDLVTLSTMTQAQEKNKELQLLQEQNPNAETTQEIIDNNDLIRYIQSTNDFKRQYKVFPTCTKFQDCARKHVVGGTAENIEEFRKEHDERNSLSLHCDDIIVIKDGDSLTVILIELKNNPELPNCHDYNQLLISQRRLQTGALAGNILTGDLADCDFSQAQYVALLCVKYNREIRNGGLRTIEQGETRRPHGKRHIPTTTECRFGNITIVAGDHINIQNYFKSQTEKHKETEEIEKSKETEENTVDKERYILHYTP